MAVITALTGARVWSVGADWSGGVKPTDNTDSFVIPAGCQMLMDEDQSAWTGLLGGTVQGHDTTPGMLYWKNGTSGYLRLKTGYNLVGTSGTERGRLLANSDGVWGNTGALAFANKSVILLGATSKIDARYLDCKLYPTNPANPYVSTYGQIFAECVVSAAADTLTYTGIAAALPNNTLVRVSAGSGALPAELTANTDYWVSSATGDTIKLATTSGGSAIDLSAGGPINVHCGWYANWGISGNTLTKTTHNLANGVAVMVRSSGTLSTPLTSDTLYYVAAATAGAISLASVPGGAALTLGGSPSGTLDVYSGSTGAAPRLGGTNPYTSTMVNVLTDLTGDTPWTTASGHNWACLANVGPQNYDQQRVQITTIAAASLTLSAAVDSVQYPGAKIGLSSRNVSIQSVCTTNVSIVDYSSAPSTGGGMFGEIRSAAGTGTTFYGNGFNSGTGNYATTVIGCSNGFNSGTGNYATTIMGCNNGSNYGTGNYATTVMGCSNGFIYGTGNYATTVMGCGSGFYNGTGNYATTVIGCNNSLIYGTGNYATTVMGCNSGLNYGTGNYATTVMGCNYGLVYGTGNYATTVMGCNSGFYYGTGHYAQNIGYNSDGISVPNINNFRFGVSDTTTLNVVLRGAKMLSIPTFVARNTANIGSQGKQGVFSENHGQVLGASYAFLPTGDVIRNTITVRSGGAGVSIEIVPLSNCSTLGFILAFEWTENNVPASAQNKSVYVKGEGWTGFPTNSQLYFEAEYISNATTFARTIKSSAEVIDENDNWHQLTTGSFTPAVAGNVKYRLYLKKYDSGGVAKIYVDAALYGADGTVIPCKWQNGEPLLGSDLSGGGPTVGPFEVGPFR